MPYFDRQAEGRGTVCGQGEVWAESNVPAEMGRSKAEDGQAIGLYYITIENH